MTTPHPDSIAAQCPPGFTLQNFVDHVQVLRAGRYVGAIPKPYDAQTLEWWRERINEVIAGRKGPEK
jgi:hypothetical protein